MALEFDFEKNLASKDTQLSIAAYSNEKQLSPAQFAKENSSPITVLDRLRKTFSLGNFSRKKVAILDEKSAINNENFTQNVEPECIHSNVNSNQNLTEKEIPIEMRTLNNRLGIHVRGHIFRCEPPAYGVDIFSFCDYCLKPVYGSIYGRRCIWCHILCHAYCCHLVDVVCTSQDKLYQSLRNLNSISTDSNFSIFDSQISNNNILVLNDENPTSCLESEIDYTALFSPDSQSSTISSPDKISSILKIPFHNTMKNSSFNYSNYNDPHYENLNFYKSDISSLSDYYDVGSAQSLKSSKVALNYTQPYHYCSLDRNSLRQHGIILSIIEPYNSQFSLNTFKSDVSSDYDLPPFSHYDAPLSDEQQNLSFSTISSEKFKYTQAFLYDENSSFISEASGHHKPQPVPILESIFIDETGIKFLNQDVIWDIKELWMRVDIFRTNEHGLKISLDLESPQKLTSPDQIRFTCRGTIRININLIRTVRLAPTLNGSATFDFASSASNSLVPEMSLCVGPDLSVSTLDQIVQQTKPVFLPRGLSKVIHIDLFMTAEQVICALLSKFHIKDNPKKFALYEHKIKSDHEISVQKMLPIECPLVRILCLAEGDPETFNNELSRRRIVLQENDTNDIDWTQFSLPELRNFLKILELEQDEYEKDLIKFYNDAKSLIQMRLETLNQAEGEGVFLFRPDEVNFSPNSQTQFIAQIGEESQV